MAKNDKAVPATQSKQLPADWQKQLEDAARVAVAQEPVQGKFLSLKGGQMTFQGNPIPNNRLSVIVLDSVIEHQYYVGEYNPDQASSPICFAFGRDTPAMKPHPEGAAVQCDVCPSCKQFEWQPNPKRPGKQHRPCREVRRLALMDAGLVAKGPEAIAAGEIIFVKIPTMSVAAWSSYVSQLANVMKRPPWAVATGFSTVPDARSFFLCKFAFDAALDADVLAAVKARRESLGDAGIMFPYPKNAAEGQPGQQQAPAQPQQPRAGARY